LNFTGISVFYQLQDLSKFIGEYSTYERVEGMIEIRIHGRGGQGNVAAAELLSIAAFKDGKFAQAFPSFGAERIGAPVQAFVRIDDKKIRTRGTNSRLSHRAGLFFDRRGSCFGWDKT